MFTQDGTKARWRQAKARTAEIFSNSQRPLLLFFGMQDKTDGVDPLNPAGVARAGFSAARSISVGGVPVRAPSQYNMQKADESPFFFDGREIVDQVDGEKWPVRISGINLNGTGLKAVNPTMEEVGFVDVMTFAGCANFDRKKPCSFCRVGPAAGKYPLIPADLMGELFYLRQLAGYPLRSVCINTGQKLAGDEMVNVAANAFIAKGMGNVTVSAEVWPYSVPSYLKDLQGIIDTFQINLELASDNARKLLAQAKPPSTAYFAAFKRLRQEGFAVSSVLQTNYYLQQEPLKGVLETIERMLNLGVVPELLPSRAVKGVKIKDGFFDQKTTFEQNLARYEQFLDRIEEISKNFGKAIQTLGEKMMAGCVACGMCNLNKDLKT